MGDGISMGRPCCGVFRCVEPLQNNRHRFCQTHYFHHDICAIVGCSDVVIKGTKTCSNTIHQGMEEKNRARGKAAFTLKERLQHAQILNATEAIPTSSDEHIEQHGLEEHIEWFEVEGENVRIFNTKDPGSVGVLDDVGEPCPSKSATGNNSKKIKAQFGR